MSTWITPDPKAVYGMYPRHWGGMEVSDSYQCVTCGQTVFTTMGQHLCPGPGQFTAPRSPWYTPNVNTPWIKPTIPDPRPESVSEPLRRLGWVCPACGKGNAPFVAQCGCEGVPTAKELPTPPTICQKCKGTGRVQEVRNHPGRGVSSTVKPCPNGCPYTGVTINSQGPTEQRSPGPQGPGTKIGTEVVDTLKDVPKDAKDGDWYRLQSEPELGILTVEPCAAFYKDKVPHRTHRHSWGGHPLICTGDPRMFEPRSPEELIKRNHAYRDSNHMPNDLPTGQYCGYTGGGTEECGKDAHNSVHDGYVNASKVVTPVKDPFDF